MLTAHLPSGYVLGKLVKGERSDSGTMAAALVGAVLPDLDMLYFYFVDLGRTHHHMFVSHWPLFWAALAVPMIAFAVYSGRSKWLSMVLVFFAAIMLHLVLDSVAAPLFWLMPFAPGRVELVIVPASHGHWILSYLLHWTFALEIAIWLAALSLYTRERRRVSSPRGSRAPY